MGKAEKITETAAAEIIAALVAQGMTLGDIARETDIDRGTLSRVVRGDRTLGEERFRTIAALGLRKKIF